MLLLLIGVGIFLMIVLKIGVIVGFWFVGLFDKFDVLFSVDV